MKSVKKLIVRRINRWPVGWDGDFSKVDPDAVKKEELLGVELKNGEYVVENGCVITSSYTVRIEAKRTRNVPSGVVTALNAMADSYNRIAELREELHRCKDAITAEQMAISECATQVQKARGLLPRKEFEQAFYDALTPSMRRAMDRFKLGACCGISYTDSEIDISRTVDIEKYFRRGSFVYEEYDGTICFISHPEKDKNYMRLVRQYSKPLSTKCKLKEVLTLGDKDWLSYNCMYSIPLKKPLTKDYAQELAKAFCAEA